MLLWQNFFLIGFVASSEERQTFVVVIHNAVVATFFVDGDEAFEQNDLTRGTQDDLTISRSNIDRGAFHLRGRHLARNGAFIDQIVELLLIRIRDFDLFRRHKHIRRADTFVRFLRVLRLVFIHARAGRQVFFAELFFDRITRGHDRLRCHVDTVGTHVGDQTSLIQTLGRAHRLASTHTELTRGFLLERRGHERRGRVTIGRLCLNRLNRQIAARNRSGSQFSLRSGRNIEFVELFASERCQTRLKLLTARVRENSLHGPVFLGIEGLNLHLAFNDQAQTNGLHTACRFRTGELAPQNWREVKPNEVVQCTAGQIGLNQMGVDLTRVFHRLGHSILGDRVECHTAHGRRFLNRATRG